MSLFAPKRISLSPAIRTRLESLLADASSHMASSFAVAARASDTPDTLESRALFTQALAEMEEQRITLDLMIEELPAASKAWEALRNLIDAQYQLITTGDQWFTMIHNPAFDISTPQGQAKYHSFLRSNRELGVRADRLLEEAQRLLKQTTGLKFPMP